MESRKKVLAISIDFDGCLGGTNFELAYQKLIKEYGSAEEIPERKYQEALITANNVLLESIKLRAETENYDEVVILLGSNRQYAQKDQKDGKKNNNGSSFKAVSHLAKYLGKIIDKPVSLYKRTFFDSVLGKQPGFNFNLTEEQHLSDEIIAPYQSSGDQKYRLCYLQAHDLCAWMPNADISYVHVDDRDDVCQPSEQVFASNEISTILPQNLTDVQIMQFDIENPVAELYSNYIPDAQKAKLSLDKTENLLAIMDLIIKDASILIDIDERDKWTEQLNEALLKDNKNYTLDNQLTQFKNAVYLVTELNQAKSNIEKFADSQNADAFNQEVAKLYNTLNRNIRINNLPEAVKEEYQERRQKLFTTRIRKIGPGYQKPDNTTSYQIPKEHFDVIVKESTKDNFSNKKELELLKEIRNLSGLELYITNFKAIRQKILEKDFNLHHGIGEKIPGKNTKVPSGIANVFNLINQHNLDNLTDSQLTQLRNDIHQMLDGKTEAHHGFLGLGLGARDEETAAFYRDILTMIGYDARSPITQISAPKQKQKLKQGEGYEAILSVQTHRPVRFLFNNRKENSAQSSKEKSDLVYGRKK